MNLPVSEVIEQGTKTIDFNYRKKAEGLMLKEFSGYIVSTTDGFDGIEEGVLILRKGYIVAALYEILNYCITVFGDSSIKHIANSFMNKKGIVDVYGLTNQQVDLVTAFNDKIKLARPITKKEISKTYLDRFSEEFSKELLKEVISSHESKESVLKKFGLGRLG